MLALICLGAILTLIGGIGMLIAAFKTSFLWGLGCLLIAPVSVVFLITHWGDAKNPFFLQITGLVMVFIGGSYA
jgi:uncharacterized membrane protein